MSVGAIPSSGGVEAAIRRASSTTGVDFDFLMKTARRESAMNPSARASTSSASGLFQFIEQTWLGLVKREGPNLGLNDAAAARTPGCVPWTPWSSERRAAAIACHQSSPNNQWLASLPPEVADAMRTPSHRPVCQGKQRPDGAQPSCPSRITR